MHCFIPHNLYTEDLHMKVVSLIRGELVKEGKALADIGVVIGKSEDGIHLFSYCEYTESRILIDIEEPITQVMIHRGEGSKPQAIPMIL
jgi:hypothetical protein